MNEVMQNGAEIEICDIRPLICELRGQAVMLDRDLAELYHVMTGRLNEAVKRNIARFPPEFMFQLSDEEMKELIANCDRFKVMKHSPSRMYAFTEQGVAMLSAVLKMRTHSNGELAESDFEAFAAQCGKFTKTICGICHDRFIIVDQKEIYWSGASLKDAGRLTFAARMLAHPSGSAFAESSLRNASHFVGAFRRWAQRSFLVFLIQSVKRRQNGESMGMGRRRRREIVNVMR